MGRVVVVGAGISGLATGASLNDRNTDLTILEAGGEPGGNVRTDREAGHVLDCGPTGWLSGEPAMEALLEQAGLTRRIVPASDRFSQRWVYARGRMHPVPLRPMAMVTTRLLPWWAKLRMMLEPFVGRGPTDETVGEFVRRRLGRMFVDRMVAPMVAGIFAADPDHLSMRAAFPRMKALEHEHRSLFLALLRRRNSGTGGGPAGPAGHLQTLEGGVGALTHALAEMLGDQLQVDTPVTAVERRRDQWAVHTQQGTVEADAVVLACPGHAQATIVRSLDTEIAGTLDAIPYAPVTVCITAWPAGAWDRSPDGFGVLAARGENVGVLGTMFTHCIFPRQAPEGVVLLRTILGGAIDPEATKLDDQETLARCRQAHTQFFGTERAEPTLVRIYRHPRGIPQYRPGHPTKVGAVRAAQAHYPGLFFTGNHLEGIGVKDCARDAADIAAKVRAFLA